MPEDELVHLTVQRELASAWKSLVPNFPEQNVHVLPSVEHATRVVKEHGPDVDVLVTGSLLLVGGLIEAAGLSSVAL